MALTKSRFIAQIVMLAMVAAAFPASTARADEASPPAAALPLPLRAFAAQIKNGRSDELRGVYAPGLFAIRVVPQPNGDSAYVSAQRDAVTEFATASQYGATGLLAHNYLAGSLFSGLIPGKTIYLIYGDGHTAAYQVSELRRYRALQPRSPYSAFVDLKSGVQLGAGALFSTVYDRPDSLILQTCIEADGVSTWGRLFVIATQRSHWGRTQRTLGPLT